MPNLKTSDETAAGTLTGAELVRIVQSGASVRTTAQMIADLATGGSSPLTTKGDVFTRSSSVDTRLAVGANRLALLADSSQTTGLRWGHPLDWFDAKTYGATGDGRFATDGTTTNGNTTVGSATAAFTSADVGKVIELAYSTNYQKTTIATYVSATSVTVTSAPAFTASSVLVYLGTDDTTAIQTALDAAEAAGGGVVYFDKGIYTVNGALQDTARSNAQLLLPRRHTETGRMITVELRGEAAAEYIPCVATLGSGTIPMPLGGSIIKSTLNATSGTAPCCIGSWGPSGSSQEFSNVRVVMRDLTVRMPQDPVLTAVDLGQCACVDLDGVAIDASHYYVPGIAQQTTSTSYGLKTPKLNNGAFTRLGAVGVVGFYTAITVNEHVHGHDVAVMACRVAFAFLDAVHSSWFGRVLVQHCQKVLVFTGGDHYFHIDALNIEHVNSGTWVTTQDIDDASNYGKGKLRWHVIPSGGGSPDTFTVNGASNIRYARMGVSHPVPLISFRAYLSAAATLTSGSTVKITLNTEAFDTGGNFASGTFTAPLAGEYQFDGVAALTTNTGTTLTDGQVALYKNGAVEAWGSYNAPKDGTTWSSVSARMQLSAGDTVELWAYTVVTANTPNAVNGAAFTRLQGSVVTND